KKYSLTVPNGMIVVMDDTDLITHGTWENFDAEEGVEITFTFLYPEEGTYDVIIGDEILPVALKVREKVEIDLIAGFPTSIVIADDVAEGEYKISIEGNFLTAKATGFGKMYVQIGGDGSLSSVKNADSYMEALTQRNKDGVVIDCTVTPWTVTATLKAGDKIFFVPADENIPTGTNLATVYVTLKEVTDITEGSNDIKISEANGSASYTFTPAETKVYSITVPEGMTVLKNGEEFFTEGNSANFEAAAGETITFTFLYAEEGTYTVTIETATE
ncbi:MAG: hypothetical protein K2L12_00335, partial [Clostridia bacterium]|nr:hypothetical protein [Clostridia bacterium]